jgi:site-specific DNA-cytosine methylase
MIKWEYELIQIQPGQSLKALLKAAGDDGWEAWHYDDAREGRLREARAGKDRPGDGASGREDMLRGLDLFSGIGGLTLALAPWVRPSVYCDNDRFAQAVLLSRMARQELPYAPIWDDIRTLRAEILPTVDIIYGGFPCQDISTAGTGAGLDGSRSGLFFEVVRLARELRPRFLFLENVAAIAVRGLDRVLLELTALGYDCRWTIVSAAEVGAPHLRERWFLLAHANGGQYTRDRGAKGKERATLTGIAMGWSKFPTPNATDWKGPSTRSKGKERPASDDDLPTRVGGQLNPTWVEWLMGFPIGWTACADWATPWFRPRRG